MKSHALLPALAAVLLVCAGCEHDKETRSWYAPPDTSVPSREPAKAAPAEPDAPATNAVPTDEPGPAPVLEDVGTVPPGGDPFPDEEP